MKKKHTVILPVASLHPREQKGSPAGPLEPSKKIQPGFSFLLCLLKPAWSDPEIWAQYVPPVFPSVREGYKI